VYPFVGKHTSYGTTHHDYPAADVFGCGATVVAPIDANVLQIRTVDLWDPATNNPAHRGGQYVSLLGDDGVRYYFAHLASVAVQPGQRVAAGGSLGVMGQTGDARLSACHTHVGISWPCPGLEWQVRRGEIWPQKFLDAWKRGDELSPVDAIRTAQAKTPGACDTAVAAPHAAES
jgi:murein DD-endopeptidase MepM/ murein hydrolase activator NlpD